MLCMGQGVDSIRESENRCRIVDKYKDRVENIPITSEILYHAV